MGLSAAAAFSVGLLTWLVVLGGRFGNHAAPKTVKSDPALGDFLGTLALRAHNKPAPIHGLQVAGSMP